MLVELFDHWDWFVFLALIGLELYRPYYQKERESLNRFVQNFGHSILSHILIFTFFGVMGYSLRYLDHSVLSKGFISQVPLNFYIKVLISFVILDISIYFQHRLFHKIPFFWSFHAVHHSDDKFTASTALRFHFGEIVMSLIYKILIISILGIPLKIFLAFEAVLFSCAAFNHSNLKIPVQVEKVLSYFLVTPSFHRVHHSLTESEQQSNYSFSVPWWDHFFKTFSSKRVVDEVGLNDKMGGFYDQIKFPFKDLKSMKKEL